MNDTYITSSSCTSYKRETSAAVIAILEVLRDSKERVVIDYGTWTEIGRVGRTTGDRKSPLLVYNSRSLGGSLIDTVGIVSIRSSSGKKGFLYQAPEEVRSVAKEG